MSDEVGAKIAAELAKIAMCLDQIRDALAAINARQAKAEIEPPHRY